ncbi:MAG TPA: acyl-CoA dehydrogenase family protein [Hyphomicrobiaceae bacterium]|nr:acyl-CoA dehydrogenase family protein [Hyphomicrobiaceae bacterium]
MDAIYFTEEHRALREQVARFVEKEVEPHGETWEKQGHVPREVLRRMGDMGLFGITYPAEYGGSESDLLTSLVYAEALSRSTFGGFVVTALVHSDMASPHLVHAGSKAQVEKYLPGIIRGETITAVAVTEPDAGSDVASIRTRARRENGAWVLNGAKMFITNGVLADVYFVAAKTDPQAKGSRGISMFIVEKGTPGFRVGRALDKMGWRSSDTAELVFEDCLVPEENLLGEQNAGFYAVMKNFQRERIAAAAMSVGNALTSLKLTIEYVKGRKAFGGVLYDKQVIRQRLAMLEARTHAARQFMYHCGWLSAQGRDCVREVSMLKALTGELANEVVYTCQQFHGGMGYMRESAIERQARDARVLAIGGGATEVMLEEVAKRFTPD